VRTLLRSAQLPERLAQGLMDKLQGPSEPEPINPSASKVSLGDAAFDGRVTLEAFSRVLAEHGCSPAPALGGGKQAPRAWDPRTTVSAISPFSSKPRPASSKGALSTSLGAQARRQTTLVANSQHPPSKHGGWAYEDVGLHLPRSPLDLP
jgi:hypothetical protein